MALLVAFGIVQAASYSFYAGVAAPGSLPTRIPIGFGLSVYAALDRAAPAPFVLSTLSAFALQRGQTDLALRYAVALPASSTRDELLARIAIARRQKMLAFEYELAAPDVPAVERTIEAQAARDPATAYGLERLLARRLTLLQTHPDDVAEAYFRMGELANRQAWREVPAGKRQGYWLYRAARDFSAAVQLAPLSEKYLIAGANQAMLLGNLARAQALFARAEAVDPGSANAIAGLGVVAYQRGDVAAARAFLARSRAIDERALMVRTLERYLATP
ncbi:MAG: tetratricopeptide repeat protein [Candidatus Eremiobacteraeota bacterium]|nr:tetratricopeptide repeat protein [Candidatus Eremiobacteraeota bacterium]MBV8374088.1 tetratricopeptide repeat protein [Candidatus Eremiobacteraeota bacterium]